MNPCKECIVKPMCINRTYTKCSILTVYLRSIYPSNKSLIRKVKSNLRCEVLWWSSENEWLCFYRYKDFDKLDETALKPELCQNSYCSDKKHICHYNKFGERA